MRDAEGFVYKLDVKADSRCCDFYFPQVRCRRFGHKLEAKRKSAVQMAGVFASGL